jgi:hypothetical protein
MTTHLSHELTNRVREGLKQRLANQHAATKLNWYDTPHTSKKMRIELLDLSRPEDVARWQLLQNNKEKYEVVSMKESHQKNEYYVRVIYNELGDDLPDVKTIEELRKND